MDKVNLCVQESLLPAFQFDSAHDNPVELDSKQFTFLFWILALQYAPHQQLQTNL